MPDQHLGFDPTSGHLLFDPTTGHLAFNCGTGTGTDCADCPCEAPTITVTIEVQTPCAEYVADGSPLDGTWTLNNIGGGGPCAYAIGSLTGPNGAYITIYCDTTSPTHTWVFIAMWYDGGARTFGTYPLYDKVSCVAGIPQGAFSDGFNKIGGACGTIVVSVAA